MLPSPPAAPEASVLRPGPSRAQGPPVPRALQCPGLCSAQGVQDCSAPRAFKRTRQQQASIVVRDLQSRRVAAVMRSVSQHASRAATLADVTASVLVTAQSGWEVETSAAPGLACGLLCLVEHSCVPSPACGSLCPPLRVLRLLTKSLARQHAVQHQPRSSYSTATDTATATGAAQLQTQPQHSYGYTPVRPSVCSSTAKSLAGATRCVPRAAAPAAGLAR
eukprot:364212-Chlamydomonas_euryale.AAC.12